MLYAFFRVYLRRLFEFCRRFGTLCRFRNVGRTQTDAGDIPKRTHTIFKTQRKPEIMILRCLTWWHPNCDQILNSTIFIWFSLNVWPNFQPPQQAAPLKTCRTLVGFVPNAEFTTFIWTSRFGTLHENWVVSHNWLHFHRLHCVKMC